MYRYFLPLLLLAACSDAPLAAPAAGPVTTDAPEPIFDTGPAVDPGTTGDDVEAQQDVPPEPAVPDFEDDCSNGTDCDSGFCVEGSEGGVCTQSCVDACPDEWDCKQVFLAGSDVTFLCVPRFVRLCRPCNTNSDCRVEELENQADACVSFGDAGSFCGADCAEVACPGGFECLNITLANGVSSKQCVPADGATCECKAGWAPLGLSTQCAVTNQWGTCEGQRACGEAGLTDCSAATPAQEVCDGADNNCSGSADDVGLLPCEASNEYGTCDGTLECDGVGGQICTAQAPAAEVCNTVDDDCDGAVDEETCADGFTCTDDLCVDEGQCSNPVSLGACLIDGSCYLAGDPSPADSCLQCLPDVSTTAWTNADGQACDDTNACTSGDSCTAGSCAGELYTCDDGLECTADSCDGGGGCLYVPSPGTCAIGTACWSDGDLQPDNGCLACKVDASTGQWTAIDGAACDDGNTCTHTDLCAADVCGGTAYGCDDGSLCTQAACDGDGGCTFDATAEGAACDDTTTCTFGDICTGGVCTGQTYSCDDSKGCTADTCDGLGGCSNAPILEGAACDDSDPCTLGETCTGGTCSGTPKDCAPVGDQCNNGGCNASTGACEALPKSGGCDDSNACTINDSCVGGTCSGTDKDCTDLDTQCTQGACVQGSCQKLLVGGGCDDGNACTINDACNGETCSGAGMDCSYLDDPCNTGVCQAGSCTKQPKAGFCSDGDSCTQDDQCVNGTCQGQAVSCSFLDTQCTQGVCLNGGCTTQNAAGGCNDGDACTVNDTCASGTCIGSAKNCSGVADQCNNGVCQFGSCVQSPKSGSCSDSNSCTTGDTCVSGQCQGSPKNCSGLNDQCNNGVCQSGTCVKSPKSGSCSDGNSCTVSDQCVGGTCLGSAKDCDYLDDQCNNGICSSGSCIQSAKSGSCTDGNSCTTSDSCSGGSCTGTPITDGFEPNNSYTGKHVNDVSDCAGLDESLAANIYPSGDEDWYWFQVSDDTGCDVQPKVTLAVPSGANYQLCAYFECNNGEDVDLDCDTGTKVSGPKAGTSGCCSTNSGSQTETVRLKPSCSFLGTGDESGYIDIRVYKSSGNTCSNYTLSWGDS
ncbi:MAG: hypothetical protein ACI9WU_001356 [Myxococcota bacterium]|jgi:hypothetical protein